MDMDAMQSMVWKFFTSQVNQLPSEAKAALGTLVIQIAKFSDENRVVVQAKPNDPASEKAAKVVLDSVVQPLSQICAAFGTKVEVFK